MSRTYLQVSSCSPSAQDNAYIYKILPSVENSVAAITSFDEAFLIDRTQLESGPVLRFDGTPKALTTLAVGDLGRSLYCAGGEGNIACYDVRVGKRTGEIKIGERRSTLKP
jgi:hypothetical protein